MTSDTYATRLMDQGVPMEHIMALCGWKSSAMAKRYARVNPVYLQKHADRLEELPGHTQDDVEPEPKEKAGNSKALGFEVVNIESDL